MNEADSKAVPVITITAPHRLPSWPRGMPLDLAAAYCGIGTQTLTQNGPKPIRIGKKRLVWLREDLDGWLDRLGGKTPASAEINPWDAYAENAK